MADTIKPSNKTTHVTYVCFRASTECDDQMVHACGNQCDDECDDECDDKCDDVCDDEYDDAC